MKLLSFDIEISDVFELGPYEDMETYAPFHVSVAATAIHGGEERVWYSEDQEGRPALNLTPRRAHELLVYLDEMQQKEFMVCAWNGLSFDLKWIGHQAGDMALAARIALGGHAGAARADCRGPLPKLVPQADLSQPHGRAQSDGVCPGADLRRLDCPHYPGQHAGSACAGLRSHGPRQGTELASRTAAACLEKCFGTHCDHYWRWDFSAYRRGCGD